MLRELEEHLKQILPINYQEIGSCFSSKLCTQITANLESLSFDNHQQFRNDLSVRDIGFSKKLDEVTTPIIENQPNQQDSFEDSLYSKFQELEERSSRVINMFPHYQSRVFTGSMVQKQSPERGFGVYGESQIDSKLKIIKDLQAKIIQLESNISSPYGSKEEMLNIEKEINLNFEHYYEEAKQTVFKVQSEVEEIQIKKVQEQKIIQPLSAKVKSYSELKQGQPLRTSYSSYEVCILVPKIIQIQIPIPSLKVIKTIPEQVNQFQQNPESRTLKRSKSSSDNSNSKASGTSIGQIIKQFNKKIHYESKVKEIFTYQNDVLQIMVSRQQSGNSEASGFNLPLDSFERIGKSDISEAEAKLRPTDRSNISSTSEIDKIRDQIWNKEELEFNQEHLSLVKENEQKSESNDAPSLSGQDSVDEENRESEIQNVKQISFLSKQLQRLRLKLEEKDKQLSKVIEESGQNQAKAVEKQIELLELIQKHEELQLYQAQQACRLQKERRANEDNYILIRNLNTRINSLEKHLSTVLEEKESESHEFLKMLNDKNEELEQVMRSNQELKSALYKNQRLFESQSQELEAKLSQLKEEISFYRSKMEEDGFRINMEEAFIIRDLIVKKEDIEKEELHNTYQNHIHLLKVENQDLKQKNKKILDKYNLLGTQYQIFQEKFSILIKNYHSDLNQNADLPSLKEKASQDLSDTCDKEIRVIDSMINYMLSQKNVSEEPSLNFIYAVSKILRRLKFCESNLDRERVQRERLTNKLKGLNLSVNRQIEKVEERAQRLYKQNNRYKHQNQQLSAELRKVQYKFNQMKNQLMGATQLTASAYEVQKEMLEMENRKLNEKWKNSQLYISDLELQLQLQHQGVNVIDNSRISSEPTFQPSSSKISHIQLASSVVSISNRPIKTMLPRKIMAPLPPIPSISALPAEMTLDKLLYRRSWWTTEIKAKFALKLLDLCLELVKVSRKFFSLKPCQMVVSGLEGEIEIIVRRDFGNTSEEDEKSLLYRAPQVLLGFAESEASYVWSVGVLIDQIWHDKLFYRKISEILSRKDNYQVRNSSLTVRGLLMRMMRKNQKQRPTLQKVKEELLVLN